VSVVVADADVNADGDVSAAADAVAALFLLTPFLLPLASGKAFLPN